MNKTMYVQTDLPLHELPTSLSKEVVSVSTNDKVTAIAQCNETGWYKVIHNGVVGHISEPNLSDEEAVVWKRLYEVVLDETTGEYTVIPCRGEYDDESAKEAFDYVNKIRKEHGLNELEWEINLEIAAKYVL